MSHGRRTGAFEPLQSLALAALAVALLSRSLLTKDVLAQRDIHSFWYPQIESFVRAVAQGSRPVWNPWISFGLPMLADPGYQIAYPLTWLNLVLLPATYYKLFAFVHVAGAGIGLYSLMRRLGLDRLPAFVAGSVWMSSGPFLVLVNLAHHFAAAAWIPWVLLALDKTLETATLSSALVLGAVAAGQVLAGSGDVCLMTAFIGLGLTALALVRPWGERRRPWRGLARVALVSGPLTLLLSAVQWVPTVGILRSGMRLRMEPWTNMYWSLHPLCLLDLLVPRLVADLPIDGATRAVLFESREPFFGVLLLGAPVAVLVLLGLVLGGRLRGFALAGFLLSVLTALGRYTPFYPALLKVTPLFMFRYPVKYMIVAGFFWGALAGLGFQGWQRLWSDGDRRRARGAELAGFALALLLLGAAIWAWNGPSRFDAHLVVDADRRGEMWSGVAIKLLGSGVLAALVSALVLVRRRSDAPAPWTTGVLAAVAIGSLAVPGRDANPAAPPELLTSRPRVLERIPAGARVYVGRNRPRDWFVSQVVRGPVGWDWDWVWARGVQDLLWPPLGSRWEVLGSFDGDFTGLAPPLFPNMTLVVAGAEATPLGQRILELAGVDYVVILNEDEWPGFETVSRVASVFGPPIRVLKVPAPLPKAYLVGRARVAAEPGSVYALGEPDFDPRQEIVLAPGSARVLGVSDLRGDARVVRHRADALTVETDSNASAYLVVLETFYPEWVATVDGSPSPILRANVLFRAVEVPAGKHVVSFEYRPSAVRWGVLLSTLGVILGLAGWELVRRRRPAGPEVS